MAWYPRPSDPVFFRIKRVLLLRGFEIGFFAGIIFACAVWMVLP